MRASFGKVILTPPTGIIGRALCGYIPSPTCNGKLDDIYAHAVLFEETVLGNVKKYMLWISMDFLKVPLVFTDYCKEKIEDRYKIHRNQIIIHGTHTHKSFDMGGEFAFPGHYLNFVRSIVYGAYYSDDKYKIWIAKQLVKLVGQLLQTLQPCKFTWTKVPLSEEISINRYHPTRRIKQTAGVVAVKTLKDNTLLGLVVNFAAHPTTLNNKIDKMSADYPGRLIHYLETMTEGQTTGVFFTGPAGDVNPITTCGTDYEALAKNPIPIYGQTGTYKHTNKIGQSLATDILKTVNAIPDTEYFDRMEFNGYQRTFWVPIDNYSKNVNGLVDVSNKIIHFVKAKILFKIALTLGDVMEPNFPGFAMKHRGKEVNCYSYVHYFKITGVRGTVRKSLSIAGVPGELFEEIGNEIAEKTPTGPDNTFVFEIANDWIGYLLPLKEYITSTGWEIFASFGPLVGAYVRNNYFYLLRDIEAGITGGNY
jgi:hypothetical protein